MNNKLNNIFSETDCLSPEILTAYAENRLNADERHLVEKHLTDCELCSDALEGLLLLKDKSKLSGIVANINKRIDKRTGLHESRIFRFDFRLRLAAAAILITVIGITILFRYFLGEQKKDMLAQRIVKETEMIKNERAPEEKIKDKETGKDNISNEELLEKNLKSGAIDQAGKETSTEGKKDIPFLVPVSGTTSQVQADIQQQVNTSFYKSGEQNNEKNIAEDKSQLEKTEADKSVNLPIVANTLNDKDENRVMTDSVNAVGGNGYTQTKNAPQTTEYRTLSYEVSKEENQPKQKSNNKAVTKSEQKAPATIEIADENYKSVNDQRYSTAIQKYSALDYTGSKDLLESYIKDNPSDYNALYYCGASYYFLNQYDNAIKYFDKVLKYKDGNYYETAQWYLALSYISKNEKKKAEKLLNEIVKVNGSFKTQAEEKLIEINK